MDAPPLASQAWESFYVIVGSTAGALTGLQFVVLTLITEAGMIRGSAEAFSVGQGAPRNEGGDSHLDARQGDPDARQSPDPT